MVPQLYQWSPLASHLTRWPQHRSAALEVVEVGRSSATRHPPGIVRSILADQGQGRAHAMVNLTNDSWYGAGHEQEQHLMLAAVRSIEHRRWLLRATSTGISAFVDAAGRVVQRIDGTSAGRARAGPDAGGGARPTRFSATGRMGRARRAGVRRGPRPESRATLDGSMARSPVGKPDRRPCQTPALHRIAP